MSDKVVLQKGLPLCPGAGKNCGGIFSADGGVVTNNTTTTPVFNQDNPYLTQPGLKDISGPDALDKILSDPKKLRQLLIETGRVSAADLKNVSDSDLLKTAQLLFASTTDAVVPQTVSSTKK
jgi:hypothetical protein